MLKILVLFVLVQNLLILVSGNPLTLIPIQKCPQNCQNPTNQVVVQPNQIQQVQQVPNAFIQQPTNNQLYPQTYMVQNQLPTTYQNQDPVNQLNQLYLNKILANPTIQNIIDSAHLYNQQSCSVDNPNQVYRVPNTPNTPCNQQIPHVVNNYFILPPEYFENNVKGTNHPNPQRRDRDGSRRNSSGEDRRSRHDPNEIIIPISKRRQPNNQYTDDQRKEGQRRFKTNDAIENRHSAEDRERSTRRRRPDERRDSEKQGERSTVSPIRRGGSQHGDRDAIDDNRSQERQKTHKNIPKPDQTVRIKPKDSPEKASENAERTSKTKSRDDAVVEEFCKKFPKIPEEVVRKLLSYLRTQLRKRHPFYHSNAKPSATVTLKPLKMETTTNTPTLTTTESSKTTKAVKPKPVPTGHKTPTTTPNTAEEQETTTKFTMPELGTEDVELDVKNGVIDDYYPDFTKDNINYDSSETFNVRNHRDNRYYYTTDRNEPTTSVHEYYMKKLKNIHKALEGSFEDVLSKPDIVDTKEPEYLTTPSLDSANFKTKQLVRLKKPDHTNEVETPYKSSTYSDAKTPSNEVKGYKLNGNTKKIVPDSIETVYARSKVVKYGKNDEEIEDETPIVTYYLPDNMQYEDNGKTVIIAKSIPADHFW